MKIEVLAFATASDLLGRDPLTVELPEGARLGDLRAVLGARHPELEALWPRLAVAVDGELARADRPLSDGCEVALLPPVSGGAPEDDPGPRAALVEEAIDVAAVERQVAAGRFGAVLLFLGTVRDHHAGRGVERLTYTAYRPMAEKALGRIVAELEADGRVRAAIVHRLGEVPVGEPSVVIAVASAHREAAYEASRLALERLKREVPIWKREHYTDGAAAWREEEPLAAPSRGTEPGLASRTAPSASIHSR